MAENDTMSKHTEDENDKKYMEKTGIRLHDLRED